ncbi:MAG: hypothetical protein HUU16_09590 [Candidatus Omnitrophica bacterium]|nr:hypothetical protein [bacterium]NUN96414.1 hypothetical protein [Candidatus Omnitrophota bacterium]
MSATKPIRDELARLLSAGNDPLMFTEVGLDPSGEDSSEVFALLSLPELQEVNNLDLPFSIQATLKVGIHSDYLRVLALDSIHFTPEFSHLLDWVGKLTGRKNLSVCAGRVACMHCPPSGDCLRVRLERNQGRTLLSVEGEVANSSKAHLEIWSRGILVRRFPWSSEALSTPVEVEPNIGMSIRTGDSDAGLEVLVEEVEFGPAEWRALLAALCLEGRFREAIGLLSDPGRPVFDQERLTGRFRNFLRGLSVVAQADGFVLKPLPVVRGAALPHEKRVEAMASTLEGVRALKAEDDSCLEENLVSISTSGDLSAQDILGRISELDLSVGDFQLARASLLGWSRLADQNFGLACEQFSSASLGEEDCFGLALASRLAAHLAEMDISRRPRRDEVRRTAELWEDLFSLLR